MNYNNSSKISDLAQGFLSNPLVRAFCIVLFIFIALPSKASHIVGGELYYKCLGNEQYEVTLTVYRDCFNGNPNAFFDDPAYLGVFSAADNSLEQSIDLVFDPSINDTLDLNIINPCLEIEGDVCIHRTIYKDTITLPFLAGGYTLAYQRCCRNTSIVNIIAPTETGATYTAEVTEKALLECDNAPIFNDWPPIFVCVNRPIDFDHSASDIDGDSLVYRMCTPYAGATDPVPRPKPNNFTDINQEVTYLGAYNENDMFGNPADPLTIDPQTGFLTGTPTIKGQFVVGICVDEYRDGILISTTRRDFQYIIGECVEITSVIGNPSIQCDDLEVSFINESLDATAFEWNFGDPTNPSAISNELNPTYTYPDTGQYIITLISAPGDACSDTLEWTLNLKTATLEPDFNTQVLKCDDGVLIVIDNVSNDPFNSISNYLWEVSDGQTSTSPNPTFVVPGTEDVTLTLYATAADGCTRSISKVIEIDGLPINITRDTIYACEGSTLELFPDVINLSTIIYDWSPMEGLDDASISNPTHTASVSQLYTLTMTTTGSTCSAQFEKYVLVSDVNDLDIVATITNTADGTTTTVTDSDEIITCEGEFVTLNTTNITTDIVSYEWTDEFGNPITSNENGEITASPDGSLTYTVVITDVLGCTASDQVTIAPNAVSIQVDELESNDGVDNGLTDLTGDGILDMCPGDVGTLHVSNLNMGELLQFEWSGDTDLITTGIDTANPTITANQDSGIFTLTITATNVSGCSETLDVPIQIHGIPAIDINVDFTDLTTNTTTTLVGVDEINVCGDEMALLTLTSTSTLESDVTYTWCNVDGENVGINGDLLSVTPNGTEIYTVKVTNAAGCTAESSITITGSPIDIVIEETDEDSTTGSGLEDIDGNGTLDICVGNTASLTVVNLDADDMNTYTWTGDTQILDSTTSQTPTISHDQSGVYTLILETTNQYSCNQIDTILIEIHDAPVIDIDATITDTETNTETTISGQDEITSCDDGLIVLTTTGVTSTTDGITIEWLDAAGNPLGGGDAITVDPDGSVTYTLQVSDLFGCQATTQITINGSPVDITIEQTTQDTDGDGFPDADVNSDGTLDLCINENFSLQVSNNDVNQELTYNWTVDTAINIFGENTANPTVEPTQAGNYSIYLETINQYGCSQLDTIPVTVLHAAEPIAFTSVQECIGFTMNFSTDNPNYEYYTWNFGDANGSELTAVQSPSFSYATAGTYTVTLTPLAGVDCGLDAISQQIVVDDSIVEIAFSYEYSSCSTTEITIQFTDESDSSQGDIKSWDWVFSNGETSSEPNPSITLSENTDLTVTLAIVNDTDCEGTTSETFAVTLPTPIEFAEDLVSCSYDEPIALNPNANPDFTYTWSNGLSGANPAVDPDETTTYSVTVSDNTGAALCQYEQEVTIVVSDEIGLTLDATGTESGAFPIDDSSTTNTITTCEDEQITVTTNTATGTATDYTWVWDPIINGTTEITVGLDGSTTHTVTVTDELGCMEVASLTVQGGPVDIEIEQTVVTNSEGTGNSGIFNEDGTVDLCLGTAFNIQVTNLDANDELTYNWTGDTDIIAAGDLTSGSPALVPTIGGTYTLYLETTSQYGCSQLDTIPVTVVDPNEALSFDVFKECDGVTFQFTNNGNPDFDYIWTFGNPANPDGTANTDDATYIYTEVGTYDIMLEIDANLTCAEPVTTQVSVFNPILTAAYDYVYTDCSPAGTTIQFNDQSVNPDNNTTGIEWTINGEIYTGSSVDLTFNENATIEISQTIFTTNNCQTSTDVSNLEIDIMDPTVLVPNSIHCQNDAGIALNPTGNPTYTYEWAPAEGLSCTACSNPIADPTVTTTYSVTVTNNNGALPCSITESVSLDVPEVIVLDLDSIVPECADEADLSVSGNLDNLTYQWFEGDNSISMETDVHVEPSGDVIYTVIATDPTSGCTEEEAVTITGTGLNVDVDDLSFFCQDGLGQIMVSNIDPNDELTYEWSGDTILDNQGASIFIPTDSAFENEYSVTVTNQYGCSTVENITAVVLLDPVVPNRGQCEGLEVTFSLFLPEEASLIAPYYIWDFGDNTPPQTGLGLVVTHTYPDKGTYNATLSLPNGEECYEDAAFDVEVNDEVLALAYAPVFDADCSEVTTITFQDTSTSGNQGMIDSWAWDFGDLGTSTEQNPILDLEDSGTVTGTLIVGTDANCFDTLSINQDILVINDEINLPDVTECINTNVVLNDNPEEGYTFEWDNNIGLQDSPAIIIDGELTYLVTITNTEQACTSVQNVLVSNYDEIDVLINDDNDISECIEMDVVLLANSDVLDLNYTWSTSAGEIGTGSSIQVSTGDGIAPSTYIVTAEDEFGCIDMDSIQVVNNAVMVDLLLPQGISCESGLFIDPVESIPAPQSVNDQLTYIWSGGPMEGSTTSSPIFAPEETTTYYVTITNDLGCATTDSLAVTVSDIQDIFTEISASEDTIYIGNQVDLMVTLDDYEYEWNGNGLDPDHINDNLITATPDISGDVEYDVLVEDEYGCEVSNFITITVLSRDCQEPFIFFPNAFSPNGDGENDILTLLHNPAHVTDASWAVYNRWGQKVFETTQLNGVWDGTFQGKNLPPDVYGFWLRATCADGQEFHKQGNITILK